MKKILLMCGLLLAAIFFAPVISFSFNSYAKAQSLRVPRLILVAAEEWACDYGILPETPLPDRVWATYAQINKTTWEVHWFWIKNGISDDVRLLINKTGTIVGEIW